MNWKNKADIIHNTSTLSPRKAEVAVLHTQGLTGEEIQDRIYEKTGDKITIESINSTISRLRKERVNAYTTANILGGGVDQTRIPLSLPGETESDAIETHVYTGQIGSGKTETALNHTYTLSEEQEKVDETIIFDANSDGLLANLHGELSNSHRISVNDQTELPVDELLEVVENTSPSKHTLVLISSAYHVIRSNPQIIDTVSELGSNVSLRFVGKDVISAIRNPVEEISTAHIFRTRNTDAVVFVNNIETQSDLHLAPELSGFIRYLPVNKKHPSSAVTVVTSTGETWIGQQLPSGKTPIEVT